MTTEVTDPTNVYQGASDIAEYYWLERRQIGTDTAVIAYVPDATGGKEVVMDTNGVTSDTFTYYPNIDAINTSWVRFFINWSDPGADTDYRIGIYDPYVAHELSYINYCSNTKTNPTLNKLYTNYGHNDVGISPFYSYMPYRDHDPMAPPGPGRD